MSKARRQIPTANRQSRGRKPRVPGSSEATTGTPTAIASSITSGTPS